MTTTLRGYTLGGDFKPKGGARGEWTCAFDRSGRKFFIKRYIRPLYPLGENLDAWDLKRRELCQKFEERHQTLLNTLKNLPSFRGGLVIPVDFFRDGPFYYKVTPWIEHAGLDIYQVSRLSAEHTCVVMLTILHNVSVLHSILQVHGDIKFDNTLYKMSERSYVGLLIDFDDCFTFGNPPPGNSFVFNDSYLSPETLLYAMETDPGKAQELGKRLTDKSDIFSLGILFHQFWTGQLPGYNQTRFTSVAAAVAYDARVRVTGPYMPEHVADLIKRMLAKKPEERPFVGEVIALTQQIYEEI